MESCFTREPEPCVEADSECLANPPTEPTYYKNISKVASSIYACEQTADKIGCGEELSCLQGESDCSYTLCTDDNVPEGESCTKN
jgi:hypothetical protein